MTVEQCEKLDRQVVSPYAGGRSIVLFRFPDAQRELVQERRRFEEAGPVERDVSDIAVDDETRRALAAEVDIVTRRTGYSNRTRCYIAPSLPLTL